MLFDFPGSLAIQKFYQQIVGAGRIQLELRKLRQLLAKSTPFTADKLQSILIMTNILESRFPGS